LDFTESRIDLPHNDINNGFSSMFYANKIFFNRIGYPLKKKQGASNTVRRGDDGKCIFVGREGDAEGALALRRAE